MFFSFKLCICQDVKIVRAYTVQNTKKCGLLACLVQPTYPIPVRCGKDTAGQGAFEPPPEDGARTKLFDRKFQFVESHTEAETKKLLTEQLKKNDIYLFILQGFSQGCTLSPNLYSRYILMT